MGYEGIRGRTGARAWEVIHIYTGSFTPSPDPTPFYRRLISTRKGGLTTNGIHLLIPASLSNRSGPPQDTACSAASHAHGTPPPRPGSTARSCAFGSDRRTWHTSAPQWRRRIVTAARRVGFRPHPPRSSSSRTGARVPRLRLGTLAASRVPRLAVVSRQPGCKSVKPAALTLRASHFMPRSLLRLRHTHRNRYSLTAPLGAQHNNGLRPGPAR